MDKTDEAFMEYRAYWQLSEEMIARARKNAEVRGFNNVEFRQGDIENMPLNDNVADVVVSNCVLNLVPNKRNVFKEIARVLKPGGHFSISDIVLNGTLPDNLREAAELYAGCVTGAIPKEEYLTLATEAGFENLTVQKQKAIFIPDDILTTYLSAAEIADFRQGSASIESITLFASKPGGTKKIAGFEILSPALVSTAAAASCAPGSGCC